jgi:hypothetical protein
MMLPGVCLRALLVSVVIIDLIVRLVPVRFA